MIARRRFLIFEKLIEPLKSLDVWFERGDIIFIGLFGSGYDIDYNEQHQKKLVYLTNSF